jgi:hypothetical protein
MDPQIEAVAQRFKTFGLIECRDYGAPFYERLALAVAEDPEILGLAIHTRPGQPAPNLLFGAVQFLLLQGASHSLARFYPALGGSTHVEDDPYADFRDFCLRNAAAVQSIVEQRIVQTNVVERSLFLAPASCWIASQRPGMPLALIEVGASAGLNLFWDRYLLDYSGRRLGPPQSPVVLECEDKGDRSVPLPATAPAVSWRAGVDLEPVDIGDSEAALWLRALVWPDHPRRAFTLGAAMELARADPLRLLEGDALDLLPDLIAEVPSGLLLCVCHTMVLHQLARAQKKQFAALLEAAGSQRQIFEISLGGRYDGTFPLLEVIDHSGDDRHTTVLARCQAHGSWIEWNPAFS